MGELLVSKSPVINHSRRKMTCKHQGVQLHHQGVQTSACSNIRVCNSPLGVSSPTPSAHPCSPSLPNESLGLWGEDGLIFWSHKLTGANGGLPNRWRTRLRSPSRLSLGMSKLKTSLFSVKSCTGGAETPVVTTSTNCFLCEAQKPNRAYIAFFTLLRKIRTLLQMSRGPICWLRYVVCVF